MTPGRYFLARLALSFGIARRQKRMADAATEAHLLREAEQFLGFHIWQQVEGVEELGIEYWNLRRLQKRREELRVALESSEDKLRGAHDERSSMLNEVSAKTESLVEERSQRVAELEALARKRDSIVVKAREVRRVYDGVKAKLEVLKQEDSGDQESIRVSRTRLTELREQFDAIKIERDQTAGEVERLSAEIQIIDDKLNAERKVHRDDSAGAFQTISDMNREISRSKAELGIIETEMHQLFGEIGRHISLNARTNEPCRRASKTYSALIGVMAALRRSILLNHRLAEAS
ncbi:chromosome segregation ATPase [Haloferula luteola]|uniref:Chromosome segregation ATPase n=1 Tax=Haloferula luteola TaxID=595692 RepID=A0A840VB00_9BACT|nr:hypothetical protein [Haloferula luteola]MBB5350071.1 chromosome segregation ATPase [Haloferula luteola]